MLRMDSKNMNFAGSSVVDNNIIASFSAGYNGNKDIYISISIGNYEAFANHKLTVEADMSAFHDEVLEAIANSVETNM